MNSQFIENRLWEKKMKTTNLIFAMLFSIVVTACGGGGGSSTPPPPCASVPGVVQVNMGTGVSTSTGSAVISFDYRTQNFSIPNSIVATKYIADVGSGCLASISTWPTSGQSVVAMVLGHNYVIEASDGTHYKFSADAYSASQGYATISWVRM